MRLCFNRTVCLSEVVSSQSLQMFTVTMVTKSWHLHLSHYSSYTITSWHRCQFNATEYWVICTSSQNGTYDFTVTRVYDSSFTSRGDYMDSKSCSQVTVLSHFCQFLGHGAIKTISKATFLVRWSVIILS